MPNNYGRPFILMTCLFLFSRLFTKLHPYVSKKCVYYINVSRLKIFWVKTFDGKTFATHARLMQRSDCAPAA